MQRPAQNDGNAKRPGIQYSVLIGRVSTEDRERILEALESLEKQEGSPSLEIVLADRLNDSLTTKIREEFQRVRLIECPPHTDLPTLRTIAFRHSIGRTVLVTEDHCVPPRDWLKKVSETFSEWPEAAAVGGAVENGVTERALDWATFLCEYASQSPPITNGPVADIAGMNVAYRREVLESVAEERLTAGFWETTVHPRIRELGAGLVANNELRISHCKRFSLGLFLRQRFVYSRYFAGNRFPARAWFQRLAFGAASIILPPVLIFRFIRDAARKPSIRPHALKSMPYLLLFFTVWAAGELVGYWFGAGEALREIE